MESRLHVNAGRQYVEQMLEFHRSVTRNGAYLLGDPTVIYEFLLANGQEWQGTPWTKFRGRGYRKQTPRHCFHNAWNYSLIFDDLTYYEGFAYAGLITVHHAWCVDSEGLVVDPTWRKTIQRDLPENEWDYFGVGFDSHALNLWWQAKYTASVLFDLNYNADVMEWVVTA